MITAQGLARLGRDVELRYTPSGDAVANLSLAFAYGKRGDDGKRPTTWVDGVLWGKRAEALAPHLRSGMQVCVSLEELHIETFTARDGTEKPKLAARVSDIDLAGDAPQQGQQQPAARPAPAAPPAPGRAPARAAPAQPGFDDSDDIPF